MEGYEKKDHGDVKTQETITMGNFAKQKNYKCHMQSIIIMMRVVKDMHNETNHQNNKYHKNTNRNFVLLTIVHNLRHFKL
jgi:hypothetical protein